jgi:uncharacterized protein YjiS (DUF1127 family)
MHTASHAEKTPSAFTGALQRFSRWRTNRRAIRTLSGLSDAMLSDMGLTRGMIGGAVRHGRR